METGGGLGLQVRAPAEKHIFTAKLQSKYTLTVNVKHLNFSEAEVSIPSGCIPQYFENTSYTLCRFIDFISLDIWKDKVWSRFCEKGRKFLVND